MKKKVQAVNPRTGKWEEAVQVGKPHIAGLTQADREPVAPVKFKDGQTVPQPLWAIEED